MKHGKSFGKNVKIEWALNCSCEWKSQLCTWLHMHTYDYLKFYEILGIIHIHLWHLRKFSRYFLTEYLNGFLAKYDKLIY